jgi:hypothetical protein
MAGRPDLAAFKENPEGHICGLDGFGRVRCVGSDAVARGPNPPEEGFLRLDTTATHACASRGDAPKPQRLGCDGIRGQLRCCRISPMQRPVHPTFPLVAGAEALSDAAEEQRPESVAFDQEHAVETASFASWHAYEPSPPSVVDAVLDATITELRRGEHSPADCTFIDIGCGKGRVLMLASRRGFRRVLGVDPVAKLCRAAEQNLQTWSKRWPETRPIQVRCEDARGMSWPAGDLVLYAYNPFNEKSMDRMMRSLPRNRRVWLAYVNPLFAAPVRRHGFKQLSEGTAVDHYLWRLYHR